MPTYWSEIIYTATLVNTQCHVITKQNFSKKTKRERSKIEIKSQPKHPWCKKSYSQESKKRPC